MPKAAVMHVHHRECMAIMIDTWPCTGQHLSVFSMQSALPKAFHCNCVLQKHKCTWSSPAHDTAYRYVCKLQGILKLLPAVIFSALMRPSRHDCKLLASAHCAKLFACPCRNSRQMSDSDSTGHYRVCQRDQGHTSQLCSSIYPDGSTSLTPLS